MASPVSPSSVAPSSVADASSASILASITRRKLAHRSGTPRWSQAAEWKRHGCAERFATYVQQTMDQHGPSTSAAYETVESFVARTTAAGAGGGAAPPLTAIPRIVGTSLSPDVFHSAFEAARIPCVLSGLAADWPMRHWTIEGLAQPGHELARVRFKVDEQPASDNGTEEGAEEKEAAGVAPAGDLDADPDADPQSDSFKLPLHSFMQYLRHNTDDVPLYIFDGVFDCESLGDRILSSFRVPSLFSPDLLSLVGELRRPPYRWLLIGPERSGSALHTDPLETSAWNTCVDGVKQWLLFPPGTDRSLVKGAHLISSEYLARGGFSSATDLAEEDVADAMEAVHYFTESIPLLIAAEASSPASSTTDPSSSPSPPPLAASPPPPPPGRRPHGLISFLQHPGETVFIPHGWLHAVLNLTPTIAVTQNYVSERNFAPAWCDARRKRPHMTERWREQLRRHHPALAQVADELNVQAPLCALPPFHRAADRRPDVDWAVAREEADSWYWNLSSSDEDDNPDGVEEEDESYAVGTVAKRQ